MADHFAGKAAWFDSHYGSTRGRVRLQLVLERLEQRLPPAPAKVLDAGGGTGAFALPLAARGHEVTLLDGSAEWLELARSKAAAAGIPLRCVRGRVEEAGELLEGDFDIILCHAVLLYTDEPERCLRVLRSLATEGGLLSLMEKNRAGIAFRPGMGGDYREARRLLEERVSAGRLGIENRAYEVTEWMEMLVRAGWRPGEWVGVRLFSDGAPDDLRADELDALLALERDAGRRDPYRQVARLVHVFARGDHA